jgi:Intracellular proteinase inhibitor
VTHSRILFTGAVALLAACTASESSREAGPDTTAEADSMLVPALALRVADDSVHFTLRLSNGGTTAVVMTFPSSQRYEFEVRDETGETVWHSAADMMYAQVVGTDTIPPSGEVSYEAVWHTGGRKGAYRAVGRVTSTDRPVELETEFELPAE